MSNIYGQRAEELLSEIAASLNGCHKIIEFGCGDCHLALYLAKHLGAHVTGIDIADGQFAAAIEQARREGINGLVECMRADAEDLSHMHPDEYDCAVSKWVLHELAHPVRVLRQILRLLRPHGRIVCCDFTPGSQASDLWGEHYYGPWQAKGLLRRAGFENVDARLVLDGNAMLVFGRKP